MPRFGPTILLCAATLVAASAGPGRAADTPDPLRFVPGSAQLVFKVEDPRKLAEAVTGLAAVRDAYALAPVKAVLDSPAARRGFQMLGHLERELGAKWPALLDRLGGGGAALAVEVTSDKAPALLVVQGRDEEHVGRAFELLIQVAGDEFTRLGAPARPARGTSGPAATVAFGDGLHAARVGAAVLVSNQAKGIEAALAAAAGDGVLAKKSVRDATALLPAGPLAWLWFDFAAVKQSKASTDFFEATRKDFVQTVAAGSTIDCLRRADFVAAGLYREAAGFRLAVRLPAGRGEFPPQYALHVPPGGAAGSRALLEPPGVMYSQSFYLDVGYFWKNRSKLVGGEMLKDFEEGEKNVSKVLPGSASLGRILEMWGADHRLVAVNHDALPYKTKPSQLFPGFGYATTMREPQFGTAVAAALRSAGFLLNLQIGLKLSEAEFDGVKIVAYRFPENKPFPDDPDGLRFNFEPCFAVVGDQFLAASTVEVCKKLIAEVKRTAALPGHPAVWRAKAFGSGGGAAMTFLPDPAVTEYLLRDGGGIEAARKYVDDLAAWLKSVGTVRVEVDEAAAVYCLDVVWEGK